MKTKRKPPLTALLNSNNDFDRLFAFFQLRHELATLSPEIPLPWIIKCADRSRKGNATAKKWINRVDRQYLLLEKRGQI